MRIMLCADIHLDSALEAGLPPEKTELRRREMLLYFSRLLDRVKELDVSAVIIAGDLFDTEHPTGSVRGFFLEEVARHPETDFLYLTGNHDSADIFLSASAVPANLKSFSSKTDGESKGVFRYKTEDGGNVVIRGLEENSSRTFSTLDFSENDINILVLHGNDAGDFSGRDNFDARLLCEKNIDFTAVGHIHSYSARSIGRRNTGIGSERKSVLCYPGCPFGRGFDECDEKGFVLLDIDRANGISFRFVPFDSRRLYSVEVDISGCFSHRDVTDKVRTALTDIRTDSMLKIILCGAVEPNFRLDTQLLCDELNGEYFFAKITDKTEIKLNDADGERYIGDISLRGEFVRLVTEDNSLSSEEKRQILRYGLDAMSAERSVFL